MKRLALAVTMTFVVAACGGSVGTPTVSQTAPPSAAATLSKWDETLAAAKKEGKVVVWIPTGPGIKEALDGLKTKYGIEVVATTSTGSEALARVKAEYQAGKFSVDFIMDGAQTMLGLKNENFLRPTRPEMLLPEVADATNWFGNKLAFSDTEGQYVFIPSLYSSTPAFVNTQQAKAEEFTASWKAMLDPKYKGKIIAMNPLVPGLGQQVAAQLVVNLGADFVKQLYIGQNVVLSDDERQIADAVARGQYSIGIGAKETIIDPFIKQGLPIAVIRPADYPGHLTGGAATMGLFAKSPNPNAGVVLFNWLTSKEGATALSRALKVVSARKDVPTDVAPDYVVPKDGVKYGMNTSSAEWQPIQAKAVADLRTIFGK